MQWSKEKGQTTIKNNLLKVALNTIKHKSNDFQRLQKSKCFNLPQCLVLLFSQEKL
jgi:hypothetical protein